LNESAPFKAIFLLSSFFLPFLKFLVEDTFDTFISCEECNNNESFVPPPLAKFFVYAVGKGLLLLELELLEGDWFIRKPILSLDIPFEVLILLKGLLADLATALCL
jgi:hypothetical protein